MHELPTLGTLFLSQPLSEKTTKFCFGIYGDDIDINAALVALKNGHLGLEKGDGVFFDVPIMIKLSILVSLTGMYNSPFPGTMIYSYFHGR